MRSLFDPIVLVVVYTSKFLNSMAIKKKPDLFYQQKKERVNVIITPSAASGLTMLAHEMGVSRSELLEQIGRGLLKVVKPASEEEKDVVSVG
ncbi:MAG: hypothetical protein NVS2B14_17380 [Chamaesiphon sp.]